MKEINLRINNYEEIINWVVCLFVFYILSYQNRKEDTLIVRGCTNTNLKEGCTTYIISAFDPEGYWINVIKCRAELGSFEIGDTVVIVKK